MRRGTQMSRRSTKQADSDEEQEDDTYAAEPSIIAENYPIEIQKNLGNIKRFSLIMIEKLTDIIEQKKAKLTISEFATIKELYFSYFSSISEFSDQQGITSRALDLMKNISYRNIDLIKEHEVEKLMDMARNKRREQRKIKEKKQMQRKLKINIQSKTMKNAIRLFNQDVKKTGLFQVVTKRVNKFLKKTKEQKIEKEEKYQINDFKDFLEEFLISDNLRISENGLLVEYLKQDEKNLQILIKFVTNPFSYSLSVFFLEKHKEFIDKYGELYIEKIRTFKDYTLLENAETEKLKKIMAMAFGTQNLSEGDIDSDIIADKSIYYIRAFYAVMVLSNKDNHVFLATNNSFFIDQFFKEVYKSYRQDMIINQFKLILYMYRFYKMVEPEKFAYNFIQYGLIHHLLHNIDRDGVENFLINLLVPNDAVQGLSSSAQLVIWRHLQDCGVAVDLSGICLHAHEAITVNKCDINQFSTASKHSANLVKTNSYQMRKTYLTELFNVECYYWPDSTKYYLPEDLMANNFLDIDQIFDYFQDVLNTPLKKLRDSKLSKNSTEVLNDNGFHVLQSSKKLNKSKYATKKPKKLKLPFIKTENSVGLIGKSKSNFDDYDDDDDNENSLSYPHPKNEFQLLQKSQTQRDPVVDRFATPNSAYYLPPNIAGYMDKDKNMNKYSKNNTFRHYNTESKASRLFQKENMSFQEKVKKIKKLIFLEKNFA